MESQYKGTAQFIQYNQKIHARPIPFGKTGEEEVYYPDKNEDAFDVYTGPKNFARLMITCHPDRFHLWKTPTLDAQKIDVGSGATQWIKLYPWYYKKEIRTKIDPENDEEVKYPVFTWFEDKTGISVSRKDAPKTEEKQKAPPLLQAHRKAYWTN